MNTTFTITLAFAFLATTAAMAQTAGFQEISFEAPHHGRDVTGAVWYPAIDDGKSTLFGDNPIFFGVPISEDAAVSEGLFPVVILSHGMGGNIRSLAWLAAALAEKGAIVVSVNHPNSTWGDFDLAKGMQHWTRAQDLSTALDVLWADPQFEGHINPAQVTAAGFSYGGWTALSLGGALGDLAGYIAHCETYAEASTDCKDMIDAGVSLVGETQKQWNASYADPRVTRVVAIDPGLIWGLNVQGLSGLVTDVRLIGLGDPETQLLAADITASGLETMLPNAKVDHLAPAMHFTAMPLCKPNGEAILLEEEDDPVCSDPEGTDRAALHQTIVDRIAGDLGL